MKIFLDTANLALIKKHAATGLIDGVTTNPSLISKEGGSIKQTLREICSIVPHGDISIEVTEKDPLKVYDQAMAIASFEKNVVVKIPFSYEYLAIIKKLVAENIALNITLVFSPLQALMVYKLGARYLSPFVGRWVDNGVDGNQVLKEIVALKKNYQFSTEVLAASIRTLGDWQAAASLGADVATVPPALFERAASHILTTEGIKLFDQDWQKLGSIEFF